MIFMHVNIGIVERGNCRHGHQIPQVTRVSKATEARSFGFEGFAVVFNKQIALCFLKYFLDLENLTAS
jgi:hypothetical protein